MTTTTMHFGPEWMRTKQAPARTAPSPPLATPPTTTSASTYSALVAPSSQPAPDKSDLARPFRFSKDDLLRIYKEGGGRGGLGLEVERWEGIVREVGSDPVGLKEMTEGEKKIFTGPLNSEVRRRQSMDYLSPLSTERPKLGHLNSGGPGSPMRERMGNFVGRRRDSTDQPPLTLPRKQSLSSIQAPLQSPRDAPLPSPRMRFDGGVLDGSWTSKRRAAEAAAKAGGKVEREPEKSGGEGKIKEEDEEESPSATVQSQLSNAEQPAASRQQTQPAYAPAPSNEPPPTTESPVGNSASVAPAAMPAGPPPGLGDLASVEWSYLDPQGQVQGPFRAEVMQKWYDDGYFTQDLLMKRTHLESDWTTVRGLQHLAVNTPIFLTPMAPPRPPEPQPEVEYASLNGPRFDSDMHRPLGGSAFNAHLHDESNPSNSPMSSYSNPHFSNNSPEPSVLGGRAANGIVSDAPTSSYSSLSSLDPQRRSPAHEAGILGVGRSAIGNQAPDRNGSVDGFGFNGYNGVNTVSGGFNPSMDLHVGGLNGYQQPSDAAGMGPLGGNSLVGYGGPGEGPALNNIRLDPREVQHRYSGGVLINGSGSPFPSGQPYQPMAPSPFMGQQDMRTLQQSLSPFPVRRASGSTHMIPLQQQTFLPQNPVPTPTSRVTQDPLSYRRPGPFDPNYPSAQNAIPQQRTVTPSQASSYNSQPIQNNNFGSDHSPWYAASQGIVPEGWGQEPNSLTVANLGQHNQLQEQEGQTQTLPAEPVVEPVAAGRSPQVVPEAAPAPSPVVSAAPASESARTKSRRKSNVPTVKPSTSPTVPPAVPAKPPSPIPSPVEHKPAWAKDEDKSSPSGGVTSLREIQETEAKKTEARKAAERERAAARIVTTPPSAEPTQTFTTSWGLPTSQAGSARPIAVSKESPSSPSPNNGTPQTPVWTTTAKPAVAKRTMKEIQEEEERRKKLAAREKETVAAAARRGHADAITKTASVVQNGGAWTTVGASGKTGAAALAAPTMTPRPVLATSVSSKVVPSATTSSIGPAPVPTRSTSTGTIAQRVTAGVAAVKVAPRVEESPAPSADFLKWLGDALKGLNSSVNLEEIAAMLLQFPLDPDPSTVEIISDLIYANSTTLDGRRFAAEFVSKRKASTKAVPATDGAGRTLSIADIVKTQPKPAQNEWGGFKVVNKKKKGTRA